MRLHDLINPDQGALDKQEKIEIDVDVRNYTKVPTEERTLMKNGDYGVLKQTVSEE